MKKIYPSDLTEQEFGLIKDCIPQAKFGGRPRTTNVKSTLDAIFYVLKSGCQWRMLPKDFPAWGTVYYYYRKWERESVFTMIYRILYPKVIALENKNEPQIGIIDSQSVKCTELKQLKGYDGHKKNQRNKKVYSSR